MYGKDYYKAFEGDVWVYHLCGIFDTINHSCNFFLYVISGSLFREEFIAMIQCKKWKERISIGFSNYSANQLKGNGNQLQYSIREQNHEAVSSKELTNKSKFITIIINCVSSEMPRCQENSILKKYTRGSRKSYSVVSAEKITQQTL